MEAYPRTTRSALLALSKVQRAFLLGFMYYTPISMPDKFRFLSESFPDVKKYRYQGNTYGAGLSYGYQWILTPRWSIEGSIGVGYKYNTFGLNLINISIYLHLEILFNYSNIIIQSTFIGLNKDFHIF